MVPFGYFINALVAFAISLLYWFISLSDFNFFAISDKLFCALIS